MAKLVATYLFAVLLVSLGFFGVGALASAAELRDPMQPPAFALQKYREAEWANKPRSEKTAVKAAAADPLRLTSIIYSDERKLAIIDDQMLAIGDRVRGAKLVSLTRDSARLVRKGRVINLQLGTELTTISKTVVKRDL